MTQKPALTPKANCKKMNTRELVSLTPATSAADSVCPTMAASLMEYTCCSRYDRITGRENSRITRQHLPCVRFIGSRFVWAVFTEITPFFCIV